MLHLTPDMLDATYELLRLTPPFKSWRLPPADELEFRATNMKGQDQAYCHHDGTRHVIAIATNRHRTLASLTATMGHEMVHLHLDLAYPRDRAHHGRRFQRCADMVCRIHSLDRGQF